jgi:hypothetical protein
VTLVTLVAQVVEMAKSEMEREGKLTRGAKRKGKHQLGPAGKHLNTLRRENDYRI